jgi:hypothetical protein
MTSGMTPLKRFVIRATLVVGSTVATIVGAESLATLDVRESPAPTVPPANTSVPVVATSAKAGSAPPSLIIVRHPAVTAARPAQIVKVPRPSLVQPPQPIVVQQPAQVTVQSSGGGQPQAAAPQPPAQPATKSTR